MISSIEAWSKEAVLSHLSPQIAEMIHHFRVEERVGSTNDVVAELMREHAVSGVICLAEEQTNGRGRLGRSWLSPLSKGFYGSLGWIFQDGIAAAEGLSLAIGVAILRALYRLGIVGVQLKWPNDVVVGEAKLGGVLIESQVEAAGSCRVVIGVGLNVSVPEGLSERLGRQITSIDFLTGYAVKRNELGAVLLEEIIRILVDYPSKGFSAVQEEWLRHDALINADVVVTGLGEEVSGIARGVNEQGALKLETPSGLQLIHAGEVSLLRGRRGHKLLF